MSNKRGFRDAEQRAAKRKRQKAAGYKADAGKRPAKHQQLNKRRKLADDL